MPPLRVLFGRSTARWPRRRYPNSGPLRSGDERLTRLDVFEEAQKPFWQD
jgi:hypothetical protein